MYFTTFLQFLFKIVYDFMTISEGLNSYEEFFCVELVNPLVPGVHWKVTHS